ncbi:MAG TPA: glycine--tRNA ligase subunit beta [Tissierellales bacterium]|nr:glycine--tRNA ligase subunit beta [Tissierellales bacterium]
MNKYLLEIGVEELPARYVDLALEQLKEKGGQLLKKERIGYENISVYATPRRLVLVVDGIAEEQEDLEILNRGPAKKIAFDEDANPTKALEGFMRGQGVTIEEIILQDYKGEEYVYANKIMKGKLVNEILKDKIPGLIKSIQFPRSMKWGGKNLRFARPIRWILSILNDKVINFKLEGIVANNFTRGHRFLGSNNIVINHVDEYFDKLKDNYVIVNQNERKEIIEYGCNKLAKEKGGNLQPDEELLNEVVNIVEYPTPIIGRIKEEYLRLPKAVVVTPMKEQLRYFPVEDDKGKLLPYFITIRNGNDEYLDMVIKGNEKVLGARLEDAKFFYLEDIKKPLEGYVENLKTTIFQEELGTLYDKTIRVQKLAIKIGQYLEVGEETQKNIKRAGYLSKADLVTSMVDEFAELQGTMGRQYAMNSGENEIVSLSIYEQYLPKFSGDKYPTTTAGSVLSIADKLDTISGSFAIGIHPTGSQDPYGLRKQALGIINILLDKKMNLSLGEIIDYALYIYVDENGLIFDYEEKKKEIQGFFKNRIRNLFIYMGMRYDIVDAVLETNIDDVYDLKLRADKLSLWLDKEEIEETLVAFNRVSNIAKKAENDEVIKELLIEEEEINLYESFNRVEEEVLKLLNNKEYDKALEQFSSIKEPIDKFFDQVMVMVDDDEVRNNRLGLLKKIFNTMLMICDLSKVVYK